MITILLVAVYASTTDASVVQNPPPQKKNLLVLDLIQKNNFCHTTKYISIDYWNVASNSTDRSIHLV